MQDLKEGFLCEGILVHVGNSSRLTRDVLTGAPQAILAILLGPSIAETVLLRLNMSA